jgi:hypothetical protein
LVTPYQFVGLLRHSHHAEHGNEVFGCTSCRALHEIKRPDLAPASTAA